MRAAQSLHRLQPRVGRILHAEHQLHRARIILAHEAFEIGEEGALVAVQGLEQRQGRDVLRR